MSFIHFLNNSRLQHRILFCFIFQFCLIEPCCNKVFIINKSICAKTKEKAKGKTLNDIGIALLNDSDSLQNVTLGTSETVIHRVLRTCMAISVKQHVGVRTSRSVITWQAVWVVRESRWYRLYLYNIYISIICDGSHRFTYIYGMKLNMIKVSVEYHLYLFMLVYACLLGLWWSAYIYRRLFYSIIAWGQIWNIHKSPFLFLHLLEI